MIITSSPANIKKISFTVQVDRLLEAITFTDIALGTSSKPIPIDSFVTINDSDLHEFFSKETIRFELTPADHAEPLILELVACNIHNIGHDYNKKLDNPANPWEYILEVNAANILELPDGSLIVKSVNDVCEITVADGLDNKAITTYVSYKVIFKSTIAVYNTAKPTLRTFYFVIDPLIKITSGGRSNSNGFTATIEKY
jgi:hypothetical protein